MTRVLITGATGFIGGHLTRHLLELGRDVRCLVRSQSVNRIKLPDGAEPVEGSLGDRRSLARALQGCEEVYHLAGATKALRGRDFWETNVRGTGHLVAACARQTSPPRLLYLSSLAAMGPSPADRPLREQDRPQPVSRYGESKLASEQVLRRYSNDVPMTVLRPGIVLGEGDRDGFPLFAGVWKARTILVAGPSHQRYSVVHARDLVEGIGLAIRRGETLTAHGSQGIYLVSGEGSWTFADLGNEIGKVLQRTPVHALPIPERMVQVLAAGCEMVARVRRKTFILGWDKAREATAGSWVASDSKLRAIGFQPAPLFRRLQQTAAWYFEQGWLAGDPPEGLLATAAPKMASRGNPMFSHPSAGQREVGELASNRVRKTRSRDWAGR